MSALFFESLVSKFQERLHVSRVNAIWRVVGFLFLSFCFAAIIGIGVISFPNIARFIEKIPLLPEEIILRYHRFLVEKFW